MPHKPFLDSNVIVYALTRNDPRHGTASTLVEAGAWISLQVLAEVVAVARRKLAMSWPDIDRAMAHLETVCPDPVVVGPDIFREARRIAERYQLRIFDSQVIAAAISVGATELLSEDMQHGQIIDGRLAIRNPFAPS